jgi:antitoxin component of RelBE/YafQ-DinJ toxin-antitoxin module
MTDTFRVRVDRKLLAEASRVSAEIGTTPGEIVRLLFAQLVKRREVPFKLSADFDDVADVERRNRILRELDDSEGW